MTKTQDAIEMESTLDAMGKWTGRVSTSRRHTALVALCFVFALKLHSVVTSEASERPIATLIKELSNSNAPPVINIRWEAHFPKTYNWSEQKRVLSVWKELHERFPEALPLLVENVDKKEYCITVEVGSSGAQRNQTVGHVCAYIIELNIQPYTRPYAIRTGYHSFLRSFDSRERPQVEEGIKKWWRDRASRNVATLQSEAVSWELSRIDAEDTSEATVAFLERLEQNRKELLEMRNAIQTDGGVRVRPKWTDSEELGFLKPR